MKKFVLFTFIFTTSYFGTFAQEKVSPEIIREAQRNVCAINIMHEVTGKSSALGCGVVFSSKVKDRNEYFIATAFHIVKELLENQDLIATISVFDNKGMTFLAKGVTAKNILWINTSMDAALLILPRDLKPTINVPANYEFSGLANLKRIGDPSWGEDIYLFGYRWINESSFIDIVKKGILSVGTTELPGYEGYLVYLIDNMANKGMSGGLAFNARGVGIGIISSYVYETNNQFLKSDDLTVCLPLTMYFNVLSNLIINNPELIKEIVGE
ncbi:MAG: serine protease [Bacteroidales bacterium]|nr:serine protease [Bacteroidales bacterium]